MPRRLDAVELADRAASVRLVVFDVDGVLTDGGLYFNQDGLESKRFHVHDGLGIKRIIAAGYEVAVITARSSAVVRLRMAELGVGHLYQGESDKLNCLRGICERMGIDLSQVCYTGDDAPDCPCMETVGLACSVADATDEAKRLAHWVTDRKGGQGAARQVCDMLIAARADAGLA